MQSLKISYFRAICTIGTLIALVGCSENLLNNDDTTAIPTPTNLKPVPNQERAATKPTFSWDNVEEAEYYEIQIAETETELAKAKPVTVDKRTGFSYTDYIPKEGLKNNHTHYWRVRSVQGQSRSNWTETHALTIFWGAISGQSPVDRSVSEITKPIFSWSNSVDNVHHYEFQISDSKDSFASKDTTVVDVRNGFGTTMYTPGEGLKNYTTHYWRIRAVDEENQATPWSDTLSVAINWGMMENLRPLSRTDFTTVTPTFSWNNVKGATHYELQITADKTTIESADTKNIDVRRGFSITTYVPSPGLQNNTTHHWRVRAVDEDGQTTHWSDIASFTIHWGDLALVNPLNGAEVTSATIKLQWQSVPDIDYYELQIAQSETALASADTILVDHSRAYSTQTYTPANSFGISTYYWRLRARKPDKQF